MDVTCVEQRLYIKIAVLHGRNARECHRELVEAVGNNALPYRTVARWVAAFQRGCEATSDLQWARQPKVKEPLRGRRFGTRMDIANAVQQQMTRFTHGKENGETDGIQAKEKKTKGGLMSRFTSMKKSKSPPPATYSMDNPVFEDGSVAASPQHPVHVSRNSKRLRLFTAHYAKLPGIITSLKERKPPFVISLKIVEETVELIQAVSGKIGML
ncbi:hypothetical protein ANN_26290 [Periplaneta americana]|uniref:Mos1 transposase HTH domain-containing protein n=1 Tax=Periplaneta americana TaxID=6978 RepID=A0ABQ8S5Z7_PERAM|nr:hypothetical protein ANN_26290 [Periplaneta americana]